MKPIRVVQWGLGAMGSGMVKLMLEKNGLQVVGAIEKRPEAAGKDLGDVVGLGRQLGIKVSPTHQGILKKASVDVVLLAIDSFTRKCFDAMKAVIEAGIHCITIAEEMAEPYAQEPELAKELDMLAKRFGVVVIGTGINPGYVLDSLVISLSGVCHDVECIEASRINDLSCFGPTVMKTQGVGTTPEEFAQGLAMGSIVGHIGFRESISLISQALGLGVDRVEEMREPIISKTDRETPYIKVKAGMVAGCRHIGIGYRGKTEVVRLIHPQQVRPEAEQVETGDYIKIVGTPGINLAIKPEIPGGIGTIGIAVNMIPIVKRASPGLKRMIDLPAPAALMGPTAYERHL